MYIYTIYVYIKAARDLASDGGTAPAAQRYPASERSNDITPISLITLILGTCEQRPDSGVPLGVAAAQKRQ